MLCSSDRRIINLAVRRSFSIKKLRVRTPGRKHSFGDETNVILLNLHGSPWNRINVQVTM